MKNLFVIIGITASVLNALSDPTLKADAYLKITDDLPKWDPRDSYSGILSVTNTGEVAFTVVTGGEWYSEAIRFYQEGDERQQQVEEKSGRAKQRREQERTEVMSTYDWCLEKGNPRKTLQPGEGISFECVHIIFSLPFSTPGGIYKAEMYLGDDTWSPVHITPAPHSAFPVSFNKDGTPKDFFYSKNGTSQWLYVKENNGKLKRVSKIKPDSTPMTEGDDAVTFESSDGTKKKLTRDQARQIIREREQQN